MRSGRLWMNCGKWWKAPNWNGSLIFCHDIERTWDNPVGVEIPVSGYRGSRDPRLFMENPAGVSLRDIFGTIMPGVGTAIRGTWASYTAAHDNLWKMPGVFHKT